MGASKIALDIRKILHIEFQSELKPQRSDSPQIHSQTWFLGVNACFQRFGPADVYRITLMADR